MSTVVKERPILFSGAMVRAILAGRKTQTRRVVKAKDSDPCRCITLNTLMRNVLEWRFQDGRWFGIEGWDTLVYADCPYGQVGDRLWVRESHAIYEDAMLRGKGNEVILYRADSAAYWNMTPHQHMEAEFNPLRDTADYEPKWRPSIHMPRWASRITLEINGVRVERLNAISEADAEAEGVSKGMACDYYSHVRHFQSLWESINGNDSWSANPWCWVIEFSRV